MSNEPEHHQPARRSRQFMRNKLSRSFLNTLFRSNQATDPDAIIAAIQILRCDSQVKHNAYVTSRLDVLIQWQRKIIRIEQDYARDEANLVKHEKKSASQPLNLQFHKQHQKFRLKQIHKLRLRTRNYLLEFYHNLPNNLARNHLISLLEIPQEAVSQHISSQSIKQNSLAPASQTKSEPSAQPSNQAQRYEDLVNSIKFWLNRIEQDATLKALFFEAFKLNANIANTVKNNISEHKNRIKKLSDEKKKLAKSNRKEAEFHHNMLLKDPNANQPFSKKFQKEGRRIQEINKEISDIEMTGAQNLILQLNNYLQKHPELREGWRQLQHIKEALPDSAAKQALHLLTSPTIADNKAEAAFEAALRQTRHSLETASVNAPRQPMTATIRQSRITYTLLADEDEDVANQSQQRASRNPLRRLWQAIAAFYRRITSTRSVPRSTISSDIDEDAEIRQVYGHGYQNQSPANAWLSDNFPPAPASWARRLMARVQSFLGSRRPMIPVLTASMKAQLRKEHDLLIAADRFIHEHTQQVASQKETILDALSQNRELITQLAGLNRPSPAIIEVLRKLKQLEATLSAQQAKITQPRASLATDDDVIRPPRPK